MNREIAVLHINSVLEEVAEENDIPEAALYAAMKDELFLESAVSRLLRSLPAGAAGEEAFDLAAAQFAEGLQPEALALLKRYAKEVRA